MTFIHDLVENLIVGRIIVAIVEAFASNPEVLYCSALAPDGVIYTSNARDSLGDAKKWCEVTAGVRPRVPADWRERLLEKSNGA